MIRYAAGNLYGTTYHGGVHGYGTVFKVAANGTETVLHSFSGSYGAYLYAGLIRDAAGNLYGTTYHGGAHDYGTVFKLDTSGTETVLHSFTGSDGAYPTAVFSGTPPGTSTVLLPTAALLATECCSNSLLNLQLSGARLEQQADPCR
jgi:uncharacterized repeat protein (TIGR03803 family)